MSAQKAARELKKCKSATFHIDGCSYVIVANPEEQAARQDSTSREEGKGSPRLNGVIARRESYSVFRSRRRFGSSSSRSLSEDGACLGRKGEPARETPMDSPEAAEKASKRLRDILAHLEDDAIPKKDRRSAIEYAITVLDAVAAEGESKLVPDEDDLSEVEPDAVPTEVRDWLASTFTRQMQVSTRARTEKPRFRSIVQAVRACNRVDRLCRKLSGSGVNYPPGVVNLLKNLDDWSFDVFAVNVASNNQALRYVAYEVLKTYDLLVKFKINSGVLFKFLDALESGYGKHNNPYHNQLHAADVTQTTHYLLYSTGLVQWLADVEILAVVLSAAIHDVEHTGETNSFHVMSKSPMALLYNDRAVLENHHISTAFRLMEDDSLNILGNLSVDDFRTLRTLTIDMVLATDMSFHFQQVKQIKSLLSCPESIDKSKALSLLLHTADIGHPAKPWHLHARWTEQLMEEFFRQGDKEKALGLPFSPLCDRNTTVIADSQIGFIDFIVDPTFQVMGDMLEKILTPLAPKQLAEEQQQRRASDSRIYQEKEGKQKKPNMVLKSTYQLKRPWQENLKINKRNWKEKAVKKAKDMKENNNENGHGEPTTQEDSSRSDADDTTGNSATQSDQNKADSSSKTATKGSRAGKRILATGSGHSIVIDSPAGDARAGLLTKESRGESSEREEEVETRTSKVDQEGVHPQRRSGVSIIRQNATSSPEESPKPQSNSTSAVSLRDVNVNVENSKPVS
ncbi:PREDICTED: calcium/calmodulin-dependent 3',5'-cyclic nucleotide phosphodiesterase 1A-like [Branchiostoma belcheri]|uniref:Phosphodiesterase n=1 Tax=Branchiostoma belcheri TaxID=7741 RepID=A0A6P4ZHS4_BRABE|nr:PREDICTED: calcium/calmodulin-dependent 3',5'-cyclic nucleotide phosphodiesterase 1A-like [Branchiostoma belcheri]